MPLRSAGAILVSIVALAAAPTLAQMASPPATSAPAATTEAWPDPDRTIEPIGPLRQAAAVGDVDAALVVATQLVNRYEHSGATDDLFEAVIWIDRYQGNDTFAHSGLIKRVQQKDCRQKVLRYHPLCDLAE